MFEFFVLTFPDILSNFFFLIQDEGWGEEAKTKFLEMVNNKVVSMMVFREEDGVLIVDLRKPPFNEVSSNTPLSLKDALVFLDLAR